MANELEKTIFFHALEIPSRDERAAYVQEACRDDEALLTAVNALLLENDRDVNIMDRPIAAAFASTEIAEGAKSGKDPRFVPGTMVGPYKLMEQIGEGGFGLVFVADQQGPVRRRVAVKIIKPGMDSEELLTRFEAERQALALMDHENIARIFDAGIAESGQPYFAMELVRGVPLMDFCDNHQFNTQERLGLFLSICNAVQHAHQKGVIHRDLKPSNLLVTLQDGRAIPKVIDFGLVKAIAQSLTERTIYTRFASMMGTPAYMSPEQAEMSNVDIDTRSDIYSLGVILYELLTGSTPFTAQRLNEAGFDELRRIIKEEEPPRPSHRFSTMGIELLTTLSAKRRTEPAQLRTLMKGDLDWIVMKALDKDRARRYPTAAAMSEDVQRFLRHDPVDARPPSAHYRFTKFARRHRVVLATATIVIAALVIGAAVSMWQASVAFDAMQQARQAEADANRARAELETFTERLMEANQLLTAGRAYLDAGNVPEAHAAYTQATEVQPRYFHVWMERGSLYTRIGMWKRAAADYRKAIDLGCSVDGAELLGVPQLFHFVGETDTQQELAQALASSEKTKLESRLRGVLIGDVTKELALELVEDAESLLERNHNWPNKKSWMPVGAKKYVIGWAHLKAGNIDQAMGLLEDAQDDRWPGDGIESPLLAIAYMRAGRPDEARSALSKSQRLLDQYFQKSISRLDGAAPIPWFDWLEFVVNHRIAVAEVLGADAQLAARLQEAESMALARLQIRP